LPEHAEQLFKGSHLYGRKERPHLDELRNLVEATIGQCDAVLKVTTTSQTLTRYKSIAPGGIRRQDGLADVEGRELVPFMTMIKLAATAIKAGAVQVDVLLDRSLNLGLDPGQLGIPENQTAIFEPGTFNMTRGGGSASFQCPRISPDLPTQARCISRPTVATGRNRVPHAKRPRSVARHVGAC